MCTSCGIKSISARRTRKIPIPLPIDAARSATQARGRAPIKTQARWVAPVKTQARCRAPHQLEARWFSLRGKNRSHPGSLAGKSRSRRAPPRGGTRGPGSSSARPSQRGRDGARAHQNACVPLRASFGARRGRVSSGSARAGRGVGFAEADFGARAFFLKRTFFFETDFLFGGRRPVGARGVLARRRSRTHTKRPGSGSPLPPLLPASAAERDARRATSAASTSPPPHPPQRQRPAPPRRRAAVPPSPAHVF